MRVDGPAIFSVAIGILRCWKVYFTVDSSWWAVSALGGLTTSK